MTELIEGIYFSLKMGRGEQTLKIVVLLIFLGSFAYSERCYQVYVCCKKVDIDCVEVKRDFKN